MSIRDAVGTGIRTLTGFETVAVGVLGDVDAASLTRRRAGRGPRRLRVRGIQERRSEEARLARRAARRCCRRTPSRPRRRTPTPVALVKDLVAIPAEWLGPDDFARRAVESVADLPVDVQVFDEAALADGGFGGILGVGQGSDRPPRLVRLDYSPADAVRHVALVGKGITFDTGGLSLKPAASMVGHEVRHVRRGDRAGRAPRGRDARSFPCT